MSNTFCPLPWNFLAVRNNGDLRMCCQANVSSSRGLLRNSQNQILNARDADLSASRNSDLIKQTRVQMLKGEWSEHCGRCKSEEENGLVSRRNYENQAWKISSQDVSSFTALDGTLDTAQFPIRYFDIRFGNKCNLACRMCGPNDSDAWYGDYTELTGQTWFNDTHGRVDLEKNANGQYKDKSQSYNWYQGETFWRQMLALAPGIVHIYFAGGEPLLIEQHALFLEKCVELGLSANMVIEYNTNATILPQRILNLWAKFKKVRLGLSIDGIGPTLEYQRYPCKWDVIEKNLRKINSIESENIQAWLACTVTAYNAFHLTDFIEWKLAADLKRINRLTHKPIITHHMAHKPEHMNIRIFSPGLKMQLAQAYGASLKRISTHYSPDMHAAAERIYSGILKYAHSQSYHESHWSEFVRFTTKLDKIRGQDYRQVLDSRLVQEMETHFSAFAAL